MKPVVFAVILLGLASACAKVRLADQRTRTAMQELRVGQSTPADVEARFGPPQARATGTYQGGTADGWTYWYSRMMLAIAPPDERDRLDATLGVGSGAARAGRPGARPPIVRFIFVNGLLAGIEEY